MQFSIFDTSDTHAVVAFFNGVFSDAEGEAEGSIIKHLVSQLLADTPPADLIGCVAKEQESIVGCVLFSRLIVPNGQTAFILSPMAVATDRQGEGIGQRLIRFGIEQLTLQHTELLFTYGDPAFYAKTGFEAMPETRVCAPWPLSQPIGWLAQSLIGEEIEPMEGKTQCVSALNDPSLW